MKIDMAYLGALKESYRQQYLSNKTKLESGNDLAGKEIEFTKNGEAVKLTYSNEYIEFRDEMFDFFETDVNVQNADPNDIFSYRPQDQWAVFSQYLSDENFFDTFGKEETAQMESILQHITDGLDSLTQTGINLFGAVKTQLDSYEAHLELASSTSALSYFSDKFLKGDVKKGFDELIVSFTVHNEKKLENYQSIDEKFYSARAKLKPMNASLSSQAASQLAITNKLGKIAYSDDELAKITQTYTEMFKTIKEQGDLSDTLKAAREQLLEFVVKGISKNDQDYDKAKEFVNKRTEDSFNRIDNYWGMLLKLASPGV